MLFERFRKQKKSSDRSRPYEEAYAPLQKEKEEDARAVVLEKVQEPVRKNAAKRSGSKSNVSTRHHAVELCEELIDAARGLEDERSEYQLVSAYLNDIQILEDMPKDKMAPIAESAKQILKLDSTRNQLLNTEHPISDVLFAQFQEEESELPRLIKRLQSNETYLDAIKRDMNMLEGEKVEWIMLLQEQKEQQKTLRKVSAFLTVFFVFAVIFLILLSHAFHTDTQLYMVITAFLAVAYACFAILKYQDSVKEIRRCENNRNQAISLENHVKIKYVNIKNAVDYTYEKYQVKNSYELIYQYEQYQEMVKERQRFLQTSDELVYYSDRLVQQLESHNLYDARIWLHYVNAILDKKDMVELKHNLILRRQRVRKQMEEQVSNIRDLRDEVEDTLHGSSQQVQQIRKILDRIEELNLTRI